MHVLPWAVFQVCNDQDGEEVSKESDGCDDDEADTLDPEPDAVQDGVDVVELLVADVLGYVGTLRRCVHLKW